MIAAVGVTYKTAPLAVRERFALPGEAARRLLQSLPGEALLLITCNRTELYGTAPAPQLARSLLAAAGWSGGGTSIDPLVVWDAAEAVRHLLAVAAGLDSMVVGEPQVLAQVRAALAEARAAGRLGTVLDRLGQRALVAGRRVRAETPLGRDRPTIPRVAVQAAGELLGGLRGRRLLLVGAGKVGTLTARALRGQGLDAVLVANRTTESARALARTVGGAPVAFDTLDEVLGTADIVITCTGAPAPILTRERLARALAARASGDRPGAPMVVVDLAVPRDVEPAARDLPGLSLIDLDDLRARAQGAVPPEVVAAATAIVEEETQAFLAWLAGREAVPTIRALRRRAEALLDAEVSGWRDGDAERLRAFGRRLLNKLLHHPTVRLRDRAATHGRTYVEVVRDLFALEEAGGDGGAGHPAPVRREESGG